MANPPLDEAAIFNAARRIDAAEARRSFVAQACGGDCKLQARIEALLQVHDEEKSFMASPAEGVPADRGDGVNEGPGTQIGPYKLLEQIGEGGFGVVFKAEQHDPIRRTVALKIVKPGMDTRSVVARFDAERQALARMDHPNVGRVLDAGATASGRPYFVMELVNGVPINDYCDQQRLPPHQRLALFVDVCAAVQHAHQKGIIHRDLKPSNVLVAACDGKPVPKLIDFGVAKALGEPFTNLTFVTGFGGIVGTLEYMSPEQADFRPGDIDTRSDIYSLGVLLYELLTGTTPLSHARLREAALTEALRLIREQDPPRPSTRLSDAKDSLAHVSAQRQREPAQLTREVRGDLDWIVMKCLEKDRNRRYDTASGLATDLQRYLHDEPVEARPPSAWYRSRKFVRRHRTGLATTILVVVLLMLLAGAGWIARDRAVQAAAQAATQSALLHREITLALDETRAAYQRDHQTDATFSLKRAEALLAQGHDDEELHQRAQQWRIDLTMVARLDEIRLEAAGLKDGAFDNAAADPLYRKAFHDYGLDMETLAPAAAARQIEASAIKDHLVAALDDWIWQGPQKTERPGRAALLATVRGADSDPWRGKLRDALERRDKEYLESLAHDQQTESLPPATIMRLAKALDKLDRRPLAVQVLRKAQRRHESDFWINHELGNYLFHSKPPAPAAAIGFLRAALALRPGNPGVHLNLSSVLLAHGDWTEAEAESRAALRLRPDYADAHNNLGWALKSQGRKAEAIAAFDAALRLQPDLAEALVGRGWFHGAEGKLDDALAKLDEAIRHRPNLAQAHRIRADLLQSRRQFDEAIAAYKKAIFYRPDEAVLHLNLGTALLGKRRTEDALRAYREAIRLKPDIALAHYNVGYILFDRGMLDDAVAEFRETLRLEPTHHQAHTMLGKVYFKRQRLDSAIAEFRDAIQAKPDFADAHYYLGVVLEQQGNLDQAAVHYRKALEYIPGNPVGEKALRRVEKLLKK